MVSGRCILAITCLLVLHGTFGDEECSISDHEDGRCVRPDVDEEEKEEEPRSERALLVSRKGRSESDEGPVDPDSIAVTFENAANKGFTVFWVAADGSKNPIDALVANGRTVLNTFLGHTFKLEADDGEAHDFVMEAGVTRIVVPPWKSKTSPRKEAAPPRESKTSPGKEAPVRPQLDPEDESLGLQTPQVDTEDEPPAWQQPLVIGAPGYELDSGELDKLKTFSEGFGVMFWNLCDQDLIVFYEDEVDSIGIKQDVFRPGEDVTTATYGGSIFCFIGRAAEHFGCIDPLVKITVHASQYAYPIDCGSSPKAVRSRWLELDKHNKEYFAKKGIHWVGSFPQEPPVLFMHPAESVGDVATVRTSVPVEPAPPGMADPSLLNLTVISLEPRAFLIPHFLSSAEAQHIIQLGASQVRRSTSGDGEGTAVTDTRTSRNTFLPRTASPIMDRIFARAADLLGVSDTLITDKSEELQLVHYAEGQEYTPHHDWWTSKGGARYITLLMYLNTPEAGGHTAFPKAKPAGGPPAVRPLVVAPIEGSAVLFYNKLPDGNSDDLALHGSLPVREGEKWLANFWVWDPVRVDD